jgi:hypothetical protein
MNLNIKQYGLSSSQSFNNYDIIDIGKIYKEQGGLNAKISSLEKDLNELKDRLGQEKAEKKKEKEVKFYRWTTIISILINIILLVVSIISVYKLFKN